MLKLYCPAQILGRNLEALVGRSQELKEEMKDDFVSVEHLLLAFLDDSRFGANVLATEALDNAKIQEAVKQVGMAHHNQSQGRCCSTYLPIQQCADVPAVHLNTMSQLRRCGAATG